MTTQDQSIMAVVEETGIADTTITKIMKMTSSKGLLSYRSRLLKRKREKESKRYKVSKMKTLISEKISTNLLLTLKTNKATLQEMISMILTSALSLRLRRKRKQQILETLISTSTITSHRVIMCLLRKLKQFLILWIY